MKKAKEYYEKLKNNNFSDAIIQEVVYEFVDEIEYLSEQRHITTTSGLKSIIKELNQKWNAIARMSNGILKKDGFINFIKSHLKDLKYDDILKSMKS